MGVSMDLVAAVVEEHFYDPDFMANRWATVKANANSANDLLAGLEVSHCMLLGPDELGAPTDPAEYASIMAPRLEWRDRTLIASFRSCKVGITSHRSIIEYCDQLQRAEHLVLDLRINDGGSPSVMARILAPLVPPGTPVCAFRTRKGFFRDAPAFVEPFSDQGNEDQAAEVEAIVHEGWLVFRTDQVGGGWYPGLVTVVVGNQTYSMGEILAENARESGRAQIVGLPTSGMAVAARIEPIDEQHQVLIPFAEMTTGRGTNLERRGVVPDRIVDLTDANTDQLVEAVR